MKHPRPPRHIRSLGSSLLAVIRSVLFVAILSPLLAHAAAAEQDVRRGEENPIQNPEYLTVFPVDDIATLRSQQTVSTTALIDFVAQNAALTSWSQTGQELSGSDPCTQSLGRRLLPGRVTTPAFEQAICMTPLGFSLYYGEKPIAQGQFLAYRFPNPGVGTDHRNFDGRAALFQRTAGTDQLLHMDVATAHRTLDESLAVSIVGYDPPSEPSAGIGELGLRDSWSDDSGRRVTGDVALAVGDYNADGELDLLVWADTSTGTISDATGRIDMLSFSYDATERKLSHVGTLEITTRGKPMSIVAAAGDFATLGTDQAMMAYYLAKGPGPVHLSYFQLNSELDPAPAQVQADLSGRPAATSYFEIDAGLFAFDPSQTSPSNGAPGFHARQLAVSWVDASGKTHASIVALVDGGKTLKESGGTTLGRSQYTTKSDSIGPSLAVGNFIGLQDDGVNPTDQIAVAIPTVDTTTPTSTVTELATALVSHDANTGTFSIQQTDTIRDSIFTVQGLVYGPGLVGLDSLGRAFFLGNPAHIQVPALIDPQYVVYMPPHHVDCLPTEGSDTCEIVNISAFAGFNVELEDSRSSTIKQESTDTSSTDFGVGGSITVSETVSADVLEIAKLSTSVQVTDTFSYESNTVKKDVNSSYRTLQTQKSATTNIDDQIGFNQRVIDIWRYPVFGMDLKQSDKYPYYEIAIPGPLQPFQSAGLTVGWFHPFHINNSALSYPEIGSADFPSDLGTFTYDDDGKEVSKTEALNDGTVRSFSGNSQTFSLTYTEGSGGSSERSYNYKMSNTVDIKTGFSAKVGIGIADSETKVDTSLNLTNKSSWGTSTVASRSMSESRGITLNQPSVSGIQTKAYEYQSLIYITGNGGIKVAHAVDFDTQTGAAWWKETYAKADPALNLPLRLVQKAGSSDWVLNEDGSRRWMRGISLTSDELNELTNTYPYLSGGVEAGDKVRVVVNVYNLSLGSATTGTQVQFAYQELDPTTFAPKGSPVVFDTSGKLRLQPRAQQEVVGIWDTGQLSITESIPYRFQITLLTDEANDLHATGSPGENNIGIWPYNGSGIFVFPAPSQEGVAMAETGEAVDALLVGSEGLLRAAGPAGSASAAVELMPRETSSAYSAHVAVIQLESERDHRGAVYLVVSRPTGDPDGRETVLASTILWGLPEGRRTLALALPREAGDGRPMHEVLKRHRAGEAPVKVHLFSHHERRHER